MPGGGRNLTSNRLHKMWTKIIMIGTSLPIMAQCEVSYHFQRVRVLDGEPVGGILCFGGLCRDKRIEFCSSKPISFRTAKPIIVKHQKMCLEFEKCPGILENRIQVITKSFRCGWREENTRLVHSTAAAMAAAMWKSYSSSPMWV